LLLGGAALGHQQATMIVELHRDEHSWLMMPHSLSEPLWLSPGAYRYLLEHTDYHVNHMQRVSFYLVQRMRETGHLRPLEEAPPTGSFQEEFRPNEASAGHPLPARAVL
jgi:hypothetical protein